MRTTHLPVRWLRANILFAGLAIAIAGITSTVRAEEDPPECMTYQGFLVDGNGVALGNDQPTRHDVIFRIYKEQTGGEKALWAERQTVTVSKGYFSVLLGERAAKDGDHDLLSEVFKGADASERYIGITVKGIGDDGADLDIRPRLRLVTSPYSFLAKNAKNAALARQAQALVSPNGEELVTAADGALTVNGNLAVTTINGNGAGLTGLTTDQIPNVACLNGPETFRGLKTFLDDSGMGGRIQVGPSVASDVPKLIVFGDGEIVYVGETGADNTLELKAKRIRLTVEEDNVTANDRHVPVGEEKLRIVRGTVKADGERRHGSGFISKRERKGHYVVAFDEPFSDVPSVTFSTFGGGGAIDDVASLLKLDSSKMTVQTTDTGRDANMADTEFMFIAVGPR
jgi:hypothetical protein